MKSNSVVRKRSYKSGMVLDKEYVYVKQSKGIIDEIDGVVGDALRLSDAEIDFIRNYDVKYRMGPDEDDAD